MKVNPGNKNLYPSLTLATNAMCLASSFENSMRPISFIFRKQFPIRRRNRLSSTSDIIPECELLNQSNINFAFSFIAPRAIIVRIVKTSKRRTFNPTYGTSSASATTNGSTATWQLGKNDKASEAERV